MEVGVKSIAQQLQNSLSGIADVSRVRPRVVSRGRKVDIFLDIQVHPAVELPGKTEEITQLARGVVEEQMGIKVGKVRVNMQYGPEMPRAMPEPEPLPPLVPVEPAPPAAELEPAALTDIVQEEEAWLSEAEARLQAEMGMEEEEAELLAAASAPESGENP